MRSIASALFFFIIFFLGSLHVESKVAASSTPEHLPPGTRHLNPIKLPPIPGKRDQLLSVKASGITSLAAKHRNVLIIIAKPWFSTANKLDMDLASLLRSPTLDNSTFSELAMRRLASEDIAQVRTQYHLAHDDEVTLLLFNQGRNYTIVPKEHTAPAVHYMLRHVVSQPENDFPIRRLWKSSDLVDLQSSAEVATVGFNTCFFTGLDCVSHFDIFDKVAALFTLVNTVRFGEVLTEDLIEYFLPEELHKSRSYPIVMFRNGRPPIMCLDCVTVEKLSDWINTQHFPLVPSVHPPRTPNTQSQALLEKAIRLQRPIMFLALQRWTVNVDGTVPVVVRISNTLHSPYAIGWDLHLYILVPQTCCCKNMCSQEVTTLPQFA